MRIIFIFMGYFIKSYLVNSEGQDNMTSLVPSNSTNQDLLWLEGLREDEIDTSHRTDSLSMLILITLLIITVLSAWFFKLRKFGWLHETGFSLILGIIVGGVIRLSLNAMAQHEGYSNLATVHLLNSNQLAVAPARVIMNISGRSYVYYLEGVVMNNSKSSNLYADDLEQLEEKSSFNPEIFFYVLLPPIVFFAGYQLQRFYFFNNIGSILTLAFIGTGISFLVIGGISYGYMVFINRQNEFTLSECMLFSAIISATDPVTVLAIFNEIRVEHDIYALVFGESVINDAVAIGLHRAVLTYIKYPRTQDIWVNIWSYVESSLNFVSIFFGSFMVGTGVACITALITKHTKIGMFPLLETALILLMSYSTFLISEVANWSGIVAVLFCGIAQKHYTFHNLSLATSLRVVQVFELLNLLAESFIFSYIGLSVFLSVEHKWDLPFISVSFISLQIGRAVAVYPLCFLLNLKRTPKITCPYQHILMWSGLRGAMAFALAIRNTASEVRRLMLTATLSSVILSVLVQGALTLPFVKLLRIKINVKQDIEETLQENRSPNFGIIYKNTDNSNNELEIMNQEYPLQIEDTDNPEAGNTVNQKNGWLIDCCNKLDQNFLLPFFTCKR